MLLIINALSPQAVEGIGVIHYPCVCVFYFTGPFFCCFVLGGVAEAKCIFGKSKDKCLWAYLHVHVGSDSLILGCVRVCVSECELREVRLIHS